MSTQNSTGNLPSAARHESSPRFPISLRVRCPASLPTAVDLASKKHLMTSAEYIRRSVIDRVKADGFDPTLTPLPDGSGAY
jgi:hypothetical protein